LISYSTIGYYFTSGLNFINVLKGEPVKEIRLINLTDWGWMLLLSVVILVVWLLIIFQAKSKGAHEFGQVPNSELSGDVNDHTSSESSELETKD
jgi:hypothetical protein